MLSQLRERVNAEIARTGKRRRIQLVDATLRDAHQCLWATRMRTEHMLPMAERLDALGFDYMEAIALVQFDASVLFLNQNPLERIRLLSERIRNTPLRAAVRSNLLRSFYPEPDDLSEMYVERLIANGVRDIVFLDALHCWDNIATPLATAKRLGATTTLALIYNLAPGYDEHFYVAKAREAMERFDIDTFVFGDAGGSLTVENVRLIVPALKAVIGDRPLEVGTHCLNATGPLVALEAAVCGADRLVCSIEPLANGNAGPSAQMLARNLREIGFDVDFDDRAADEIGEYLASIAEENDFPLGLPAEYDPAHFVTQYAGGAISNLQSQLQQAGIADKLPAVLDEIARVRVELGSPVMATPFPAIIAAQAVMNVLTGERYKVVPDEVKKYVCGYFGALPLPVVPEVRDLVLTNGSRDVALEPPILGAKAAELRRQYPDLSDDERMLRYMYGDEKIAGLVPTKIDDTFSVSPPVHTLIAGLAEHPVDRHLHVVMPDFELRAQ
jgi:oxaloacetate decarboxylase alpha subunit